MVTASQGHRAFVVTEVDQDSVRGDGVEVPIDDVVALEKRKLSPARTGLGVFGGLAMIPSVILGVSLVAGLVGL